MTYPFRLLTMYFCVALLRRVFWPRALLPQRSTAPFLRPTGDFASPPPWGWSRGDLTTPRTCGLRPRPRFLPALPIDSFSCSALPTSPTVARQVLCTILISPLGRRRV